METFSLESGKVILIEQEAVTMTAWEEDVLEAEVSHHCHGVGFPSIGINKWPPMIVWHGDFRKQAPVLCATGNIRWLPSNVLLFLGS